MKQWQKIVGVIIISVLAIANAWAIIDYIHLAEVAGAWSAEVTRVFYFRRHFWIYTILSIIDFFIIMTLFICLWRKGGN